MRIQRADGSIPPVSKADVREAWPALPDSVIQTLLDMTAKLPDHTVDHRSLSQRLGPLLERATVQTWVPLLQEALPSHLLPDLSGLGPTTVFVCIVPPVAASTLQPSEIPRIIGVTRVYSSYALVPDASEELRTNADAILLELARTKYKVELPDFEDPKRREVVSKWAQRFGRLMQAARLFGFATVANGSALVVAVPPGGLPPEVAEALVGFASSLRPHEWINRELLVAVGLQVVPPPQLEASWADFNRADDWLRPSGDVRRDLGRRLKADETIRWWVEGTRTRNPAPLTADELLTESPPAGDNIIIIDTFEDPPEIFGEELKDVPCLSLLLALSDLHFGQGVDVDNADEVYAGLEAALIETIEDWAARVRAFRSTYGQQLAYLVLHGDILDFWSADLVPQANGGFGTDAIAVLGGTPEARKSAAQARMNRIYNAHLQFFKRVNLWIDEDPLNFCVYVCGNHDDYLVRFGLGPELAGKIHSKRAVFAANSAYFPLLKTVVEHGHRVDEFNRFDPASIGISGSPGELLVSMLLNPLERGGASALNASVNLPGTLGELSNVYNHFARCRAVSPRMWDAWFGCADNLSKVILDVVADAGGRQLARASPVAAEDAKVHSLDSDIESVLELWLQSDFQDWVTCFLGPTFQLILPPEVAASLAGCFHDVSPNALGFDPQRGLGGNANLKVHIVGHTHEPGTTTPRLEGRDVPAQHVNTGTGQDTWEPEDKLLDFRTLGLLGVEWSRDELKPVPKSQYALVYLAPNRDDRRLRIHVEGGKYRTLQAYAPHNTRVAGIAGRLVPQGTNYLKR